MSVLRDVKIVFQDVDGCMNTPDASDLSSGPEGGLTPEQARLLGEIGRAIDASSVEQVVLNTGRSLEAVGYIADALASKKIRYLLTEHAAHGFDAHASKPLDLVELARRSGMPERVERYAGVEHVADAIAWYREVGQHHLAERFGTPMPPLPKAANLTVALPEGLPGPQLLDAVWQLLRGAPDVEADALVYHHNEYYVDVLCDVGKGDGALLMLELLELANADALAAGDGTNDLSMFEDLDRGFCPANAAPELKQLCRAKGGTVSSQAYGAATLELYRKLG